MSMDAVRVHVYLAYSHNLVWMVDFVETKRKGNRSQSHDHHNVDLLCIKQLLDVAAIALAMV